MSDADIRFDGEPADERRGATTRVRGVIVGIGAAIAVVLVGAMLLASEPAPLPGAQSAQVDPVRIERAAMDGWETFAPVAGEQREGFPAPMVNRVGGVCIGFGRVDFGPDDARPSLARCVGNRPANMAPDEIRVLLSITSGFDTWHFIEAPGPIDAVSVRLADGDPMAENRILLSGSTAALRLENDRDLASVEWTTQSLRYRCVPDPIAWRTSEFCADRD